jgi:type IV pilus assembly protein PilW
MIRQARIPQHRQQGFTLIELMVGVVLALMTTVIIAQVLLNSEGLRRTTTSGSDAQVNGAVGLYALQRDIQAAGYGIISTPAVLGCTIKAKYGATAATNRVLAPVVIDTSSGSTVIKVMSSGKTGFAIPMPLASDHAKTATSFTVKSSVGVANGDIMMAVPAAADTNNWCTIFQVATSGAATLTSTVIPHGTAASSNWNQPGTSTDSLMPTNGYVSSSGSAIGSSLVNLGSLRYREYSVSSNNLVVQDAQADSAALGAASVVTPQVVLMRALYGKDTTATKDGVVDQYDTTAPTTADGWSRVLTIRIALVTRSDQRENKGGYTTTAGEVTTADPQWDVGTATTVTGAALCTGSTTRKCLTLQVSPTTGTSTEWKHYRYKVYDTVIPLRNMLWSPT